MTDDHRSDELKQKKKTNQLNSNRASTYHTISSIMFTNYYLPKEKQQEHQNEKPKILTERN